MCEVDFSWRNAVGSLCKQPPNAEAALSFELRPRNRKDVSVPSGKNIASSVRRCLGCLDKPINKPKARCVIGTMETGV